MERGFKTNIKLQRKSENREYHCILALIQTETHSILGIEIPDEKTGDSKKAIELNTKAISKMGSLDAVYGDVAYECKNISFFQFCSRKGAEPIIRVRNNASTRACGCIARANVVREFRMLGEKMWKKKKRYGKRWAVEHVCVSVG